MELDLTLDAGTVHLNRRDPPDLFDPRVWETTLLTWIERVRQDSAISCPGLVRRAEEISLGLRFTDDASICELNGTWRQRQEPTDVLSFAALEDAPDWLDDGSVELGDIVISLDTARRQALEHNHSLKRELQWLASHGLLHLLGWDHPDDASLDEMLACQDLLLSTIGPADSAGGNVQSHGPESINSDSPGDAH